jgi:cyclin B
MVLKAYTYCGASCIEVEMEEADEIPSWVENLDEEDAGNPLAVVDYVEDIYDFYRKTEVLDLSSFFSFGLNE